LVLWVPQTFSLLGVRISSLSRGEVLLHYASQNL